MMFSGVRTYQDFLLNPFFWLRRGILYRLKRFPDAFHIAHLEGDQIAAELPFVAISLFLVKRSIFDSNVVQVRCQTAILSSARLEVN